MAFVKKNKKIDDFINGSDLSSSDPKLCTEWKLVGVRIRADLLKSIDNDVKNKIGFTRTQWILQAIQKYLKE